MKLSNFYIRISLILSLIFYFFSNIQGQRTNYPGGVSSGNINLWLDAGSISSSTSTSSANWRDEANITTPKDAVYKGGGGNSYGLANQLNFNQVVSLSGNDWFESPLNIKNMNSLRVFMVYKITSASAQPLWGNGDGSKTGKQAKTNKISSNSNLIPYTGGDVTNTPLLNNIELNAGTNSSNYSINGQAVTPFNSPSDPSSFSSILIGRSKTNGNKYIGDIAEVVVCDNISSQEVNQIESYLAIKYGIHLDHGYVLIGNGTPSRLNIWERNLPTTPNQPIIPNPYHHNVFGIAKFANSALVQLESKSQASGALLTISTSSLTNNHALMFGHNDMSTTMNIPFLANNSFWGKGKRMERIWTCKKTGGVSPTISISISPPTSTNFSNKNIVLLISNNENFVSSPSNSVHIHKLTIMPNGEARADNITLNNGDFLTYAILDVAMWVKADASSNNTISGSKIVLLSDNVEGLNPMTVVASKAPKFNSNNSSDTFNFNPYIEFNQNGTTGKYLEAASFTGFDKDSTSIFMITKRAATSSSPGETLLSYAVGNTGAASNEIVITNPANVKVSINHNTFNGPSSNINIKNNRPYIISTLRGNTPNFHEIFFNGRKEINAPSYKSSHIIAPRGSLIFGQEQDSVGGNFDPNQEYKGDFAEAIVFNKRVSDNEQTIVESYLAIKYGINLQHDYKLSDGSISWQSNTATGYNNNITGIGKDNAIGLDQAKSRSQSDPANVDITIEATGAITDLSHLLWGCNSGNYDNFQTNTNLNQDVSSKIWTVRNYQNKVSTVNIVMDIPPSLIGLNFLPLLLIDTQDDFLTVSSVARTIQGLLDATNGIITFSNVQLNNNKFFALAKDITQLTPTFTFTNNSNNANPSSYEACPNDQITIGYTQLLALPDKLQYLTTAGTIGTIAMQGITGTANNGTITFIIPNDASSGTLSLLDGNNNVLVSKTNFIVHNPIVNFFPAQNILCATDIIPIYSIPSGGIFSAANANTNAALSSLINANNEIVGANANWNANQNDIFKDVNITYAYTPTYLDGSSCPLSIDINKTVTIRDNRLNSMVFHPIVVQTTPPTIIDRKSLTLAVGSSSNNTFKSILPSLSSTTFPYTYRGAYVASLANSSYDFLTDTAGTGQHPITLSYNNGGCIGELTTDILVTPAIRFLGLEDTVCRQANPVSFTRDVAYLHQNTIDTFYHANGSISEIIYYERNRITDIRVDNQQLSPIITPIMGGITPAPFWNALSPNPSPLSNYQFNVNQVATASTNVNIEMDYTTYIKTVKYFISGLIIPPRPGSPNPSFSNFTKTAAHIVYIEPRNNVSFTGLQTAPYCENDSTVTLVPSPNLDYSYRTYFKVACNTGIGYNIKDTLINSTQFNPHYHYSKHVANNDRHLSVRLTYIVDRYGCKDSSVQFTEITAPVKVAITTLSPYCSSSSRSTVNAGFIHLPLTGGTGAFVSSPWLVPSSSFATFTPSLAPTGISMIQYSHTDSRGCTTISEDSIRVLPPPNIDLIVNPIYCANSPDVILKTKLNPANTFLTSNIQYAGSAVSGNLFTPSTINGNTTTTISVAYTDPTTGCIGTDNKNIRINPLPTVSISGFNSNSGSFQNQIYDSRYCYGDTAFSLTPSPLDTSRLDGILTGFGVVFSNGTYTYTPLSPNSTQSYFETVSYTYTDRNSGCSNTDSVIVIIDEIPTTTLRGLDSAYCANDPSIIVSGLPDSAIAGTLQPVYSGPGLSLTGTFTPALAGTGQKILSYTYTNGRACSNTAFDTIIIHKLPNPTFTGFKNEYCIASPDTILLSTNYAGASTSYFFWGTLITDSIGVLSPGADTSGTQIIYYSYTDTLGCTNTSSNSVFIHPLPPVLVNGLDTAYCYGNTVDIISLSPAPNIVRNHSPHFTYIPGTNMVQFTPDSVGNHSFEYTYRDRLTGCKDTVRIMAEVYKPHINGFSGLDPFYCEIVDTSHLLTGLDPGSSFSGSGIIYTGGNYRFKPSNAGPGIHNIRYNLTDTFSTSIGSLICSIAEIETVTVRELPVPVINAPTNNSSFCSTDPNTLIELGTAYSVFDSLFSSTGAITVLSVDTFMLDTTGQYNRDTINTYYFSPDTLTTGTHTVHYIARNQYGCEATRAYTYRVDEFRAAQFFIDSVYCESDSRVALFGVPGGGVFTQNGNIIPDTASYYYPNPLYTQSSIGNPQMDTITYVVQYGACEDTLTKIITVNPVPNMKLEGPSPLNLYCMGTDTISFDSLSMLPRGGQLVGPGVLFGRTDIILNIAGKGNHIVTYNYTDSNTLCSNAITDTFIVIGQPDVNLEVIGGCQGDNILFLPDNQILGLQHQIDTISSIYWDFEGLGNYVSNPNNHRIDSVYHTFATAGVYFPKLIVRNRDYCSDTAVVRLVVSPLVNYYPYDQTFENSHGNWYAETRDTSYLLWEWGIDSNNNGIAAAPNKIWQTNLNSSYTGSEDAWVYSPCFDLNSLDRPMIKLNYWSDTRNAIDGTVLEYQEVDGSWTPLGEMNRGINWYNTAVITGQPGDQQLAPVGWSGKSLRWQDARYKLDEFLTLGKPLRMRMAFGSPAINLDSTDYYDGFAFDNVWIGNRTRNVLLESTSNSSIASAINTHVYLLAFHSEINKDIIYVQYNCCSNTDEFYIQNTAVPNVLSYYTGGSVAGNSFINGSPPNSQYSSNLRPIDFEQAMLETPKFDVSIDTFFTTGQYAEIRATITAKENLPLDLYNVNTTITEDSLVYTYPNNNMIQGVARKNDSGANAIQRAWQTGDSETITFNWNYAASSVSYDPNQFKAVVFVQNNSTREVYQVASTRDVSGYWVGVDKLKGKADLTELNSMNLYPNPAENYFQVDFKNELKKDYQWKLIDVRGVEIQAGQLQAGQQNMEINSQDLPAGVYIFVVQNDKVFSQKKVIINRR